MTDDANAWPDALKTAWESWQANQPWTLPRAPRPIPKSAAGSRERAFLTEVRIRYVDMAGLEEEHEASFGATCSVEALKDMERTLGVELPAWYVFLATRLFDGSEPDDDYCWTQLPRVLPHAELMAGGIGGEMWMWSGAPERSKEWLSAAPTLTLGVEVDADSRIVRCEAAAMRGLLFLGDWSYRSSSSNQPDHDVDYFLCVRGPHAGHLVILSSLDEDDHEDDALIDEMDDGGPPHYRLRVARDGLTALVEACMSVEELPALHGWNDTEG